jgi:membrane-bound lytic murein transglycosylase D
VEPGDTLWSLSRHYGISVSSIERQNPGLAGRYLRPGETIVIPAVGEVSPIERQPVTLSRPFNSTHIVAEGDTLWSLSRRYGVGIEELATANAMELGGTLSIGRTLRVPIIEG